MLDHFDNTWLYLCILVQVKKNSFARYIESRKNNRKDSTILLTTSYFDLRYFRKRERIKSAAAFAAIYDLLPIFFRRSQWCIVLISTVPSDASGAPLLILKSKNFQSINNTELWWCRCHDDDDSLEKQSIKIDVKLAEVCWQKRNVRIFAYFYSLSFPMI